MRHLLMLLSIALASFAYAPPTCPDDSEYDCWPCDKKIVTNWFACCYTLGSGWCCQAECREVQCWVPPFPCPMQGDHIERNYDALAEYGTCGADGFCKP